MATEEPARPRSTLVLHVPSAEGRVGGRSGRPPQPHHARAGTALVACLARGRTGGSGRGVIVEGVRDAGVQKSSRRLRPGSASSEDLGG